MGNYVAINIDQLQSSTVAKIINTTRFEEIKRNDDNIWAHEFTKGINKVTLDIPYFFIWKKKATIFEIEVTDVKTNESKGGITLISKRMTELL